MIIPNPQLTSRKLVLKIGISNGSAYYLLTSLVEKGFIKLINLEENPKKLKYSYLLTPKGIHEKSLITSKFLMRKKQKCELLEKEIIEL